MSPPNPWPPPSPIRVRARRPADFPAIRALAERVYPQAIHPPEAVWTEMLLASHLHFFPEGQLVVEGADGILLADSSTLRVDQRQALAPHTWDEITGEGSLSTHDPEGDTLYGVDVMVDPSVQGAGIGAHLYRARFDLARSLGCTAFTAGARIPGYGAVAGRLSVEQYVEEVVAGTRFDPTLSRQLQQGFQTVSILPNYFRDPESLDFAVLISRPIG